MRTTFRLTILAAIFAASLGRATSAPPAEAKPKTQPERYNGVIMVTNAPATGIVRVRLTIDRLSTEQERRAYAEAIKAKGSEGLAAAMEKVTVGYIQFDQNLRYPIAYAIKANTDKGLLIRVATNRPIAIREQTRGFVSKEYSIGVMELRFPADGPGEGAILAAAKVEFNDKGQLEVSSLPQNTGPQRVSQVEREDDKKK